MKKINQPLYEEHIKEYYENNEKWMGPLVSYKWRHDPRYLVFMLSRYKHASKFLRGKSSVVDFGCGDAMGLPILNQEVPRVHGVDTESLIIEDNIERDVLNNSITLELHNMITDGPLEKKYNSGVSFDVLSSIPVESEDIFMQNICSSLDDDAIFVLGAQNKNSTKYSFEKSQAYQSNFKNYDEMHYFFSKYFHNQIILGMNDEVIHTSRETMTQYFIVLGITPKR